MDKQQRAKMYQDFLLEEGYTTTIDDDGDVIFKSEGRTYAILIDDRDEDFFRIVFPNFWPIESKQERLKVEQAALQATAETKVAKVFPVRDNVWASIEMFCSPPDVFKAVFARSMSALRAAVGSFAEKMAA
ncbi:MAG: hypothetical protein ONB30_05225 [candidate division KSB1 bacterium]|nr:hypothetical protein [candidate division KSB1 bacterium]MDZ7412774.1 hypothetical protein [candidate division KSB1 bacterium]